MLRGRCGEASASNASVHYTRFASNSREAVELLRGGRNNEGVESDDPTERSDIALLYFLLGFVLFFFRSYVFLDS